MKERQILFSGEMVRPTLADLKSVTRRTRGLNRVNSRANDWGRPVLDSSGEWVFTAEHGEAEQVRLRCPYGQPGDRLWVRENFQPYFTQDPYDMEEDDMPDYKTGNGYAINYVADGKIIELYDEDGKGLNRDVTPSIHMPRWASRITLEVTGVRVERVQEITGEGAIAEGCLAITDEAKKYAKEHLEGANHQMARYIFQRLWDSLNAKRGFGWDKNPWVWVVEFRRVQP